MALKNKKDTMINSVQDSERLRSRLWRIARGTYIKMDIDSSIFSLLNKIRTGIKPSKLRESKDYNLP